MLIKLQRKWQKGEIQFSLNKKSFQGQNKSLKLGRGQKSWIFACSASLPFCSNKWVWSFVNL